MENEVIAKMADFLKTDITPDALALNLRRLKLEVVRLLLNEGESTCNKDWVANGLYFLDNVCEILDPYLEKE